MRYNGKVCALLNVTKIDGFFSLSTTESNNFEFTLFKVCMHIQVYQRALRLNAKRPRVCNVNGYVKIGSKTC